MPPPIDEIDKSRLLDFLREIDREMPSHITLVAAGGTALTLRDVKLSTRDVDFTGPREDIALFDRVQKSIPHGWKIDTWADGWVFDQRLPPDYLAKSKSMKRFKNIELRALDPLDIVVTKIGRLEARDFEDIEECIHRFKLTKSDVKKRASQLEHLSNVDDFEYHLSLVLQRFFK
jgi:hypothetical protein